MEPSTDDLLARATTGEPGAIEGLMVRFLPGLRGYLGNRAGGLRHNESVSDIAQSVCREVLAHLRDGRLRFRGQAEFKQWFYRAAALKLSERRRFWRSAGRDAVEDAGPAAPGASDIAWDPAADATPSEDAMLREEAERFRRAFEELDGPEREVVELFHVEGLSHAEIAARLAISATNSRVRLARALARLARLGAQTPRGGRGGPDPRDPGAARSAPPGIE
jgi:RNA polymerase sigma-70 factor (ECF subfamily)